MNEIPARSQVSPVAFEVLLALAERERHGYDIMLAVEERTSGRITLHPGTLYRALNRMLGDGLIAESEERPDPEWDDERRRYYRLTTAGRRAARAEALRMADQVAAARARKLVSTREVG